MLWAGAQIQEADSVLLMCSAQYSATVCKSPLWDDSTGQQWPDVPDELKFKFQEPDLRCEHWRAMPDDLKFKLQEYQLDESKGKKNKVPYTWWDWHFMIQDMESGRAEKQKFIPVGFMPYSSSPTTCHTSSKENPTTIWIRMRILRVAPWHENAVSHPTSARRDFCQL